jgi:hypothetical protein
MDAFEQVVSEILWMSGFWVRTSVKVELTKLSNSGLTLARLGIWYRYSAQRISLAG